MPAVHRRESGMRFLGNIAHQGLPVWLRPQSCKIGLDEFRMMIVRVVGMATDALDNESKLKIRDKSVGIIGHCALWMYMAIDDSNRRRSA
jgi:hypothetical protein